MLLSEYAKTYHRRVGGSPGYGEQLFVLTKRLPWEVADLTADRIDDYLTAALQHLAPSTVQNHRRMLNTLRRAAAKDGLLVDASIATSLRRVKHALPIVRAWSHDEIRKLLSVAAEMPGNFRQCPRRVLMPAWILVAYSSGLRLGDMLQIRHDHIRGDRLAFVMQKTGRPHVVVLDANALHAIASLPVVGPKIFGSHVSRWRMIPAMRETVQRAGLTGSGKFLRRSSATYAEIAGISATGHLGHLTAGLAQRHYVDPLLVAELKKPVPPITLDLVHNP